MVYDIDTFCCMKANLVRLEKAESKCLFVFLIHSLSFH